LVKRIIKEILEISPSIEFVKDKINKIKAPAKTSSLGNIYKIEVNRFSKKRTEKGSKKYKQKRRENPGTD